MKLFFCSLFITCSLAITAYAAQEPMRDMSLSVEETLRQPAAPTEKPQGNGAGTGFDDSVQIDPDLANQMRDLHKQDEETKPHGNAQGFMANYCSAGYTSPPRADSTTQACQESQRQQACERFRHATIDVQRVLDRAINCEYIAGGGEKNPTDCDGSDAGRLDLLKQYWQDEESSYTILFLPDMVLNAESICTTKNIHKGGFKE